jgi:Alpha/beta hydrolase domain
MRGARGIGVLVMSAVVAVASAGLAAMDATAAAPAAGVQQNYPPVDISKLVVREFPAGTPQTSATVSSSGGESDASRALDPGYVEKEYLVKGEASTYTGPTTGPVEVGQSNVPYATRVLVRYPTDPSKFSGRVVVEPFNTSNNGADLDAVWDLMAPMLQKRGDAWVGVTERASAATALKQADPARYADLEVSTNDVAWDVLAQVGAAIKKGGAQSPLPGLDAKHLYMAGYSQSGVDTAAFAMALAKHYGTAAHKPVYDGYFPAAHAASVTPLEAGTSVVPKFEYPVQTAVGVPVVNLEDMSGVEGFSAPLPESAQAALGMKEYTDVSSASVRRPDSDQAGDQYRLYEVAGMPHAPGGSGCEGPASTFPDAAVVRGTFALLNRWVETGQKPPRAPRIKMADIAKVSKVAVDANGNAVDGIRSPYLDDALVRYDVHAPGAITCELAGHETSLDRAALAKKYPSVDAYMKQFTKGVDAMIKTGYILPMDRAQLIADQKEKATQVLGQ